MATDTETLRSVSVELKGTSPLILNNAQQVDPFYPWTREKKKITSKKKKTDEDLLEIARLEFHGALYVNEAGRLILPADNLLAAIRDGAKRDKRGKEVQCGVFVFDDADLIIDGQTKESADLWEVEKYRYMRVVRMQSSKVLKCRPIFHKWSAKFKVEFDVEVMNKEDLMRFLEIAGKYCAIGDYRPRFGRFDVN